MMKSHEDKKSVNVSPISISRADIEILFIQNSFFGLNVSTFIMQREKC